MALTAFFYVDSSVQLPGELGSAYRSAKITKRPARNSRHIRSNAGWERASGEQRE